MLAVGSVQHNMEQLSVPLMITVVLVETFWFPSGALAQSECNDLVSKFDLVILCYI